VGDAIARTTVLDAGTADGWAALVRNLGSDNPVILFDTIAALKKSAIKPKPEDAAPFRAVLLATHKLDEKSRWKGIELLRQWSNDKRFGAADGDGKKELAAWARWYAQTFPKEPSLPITFTEKPPESKYKFDELLAYLEKDPTGKKGDPAKGRVVFEKGQCIKCHKFGTVGEGLGPDLTTLAKRFKRADTLESLVDPSKAISDQYRSTTVVTNKGQQFTGLLAVQGGMIVILQQDGTKVMLKEDDVAERFASLISVMPERLLDALTKEEIADLFAFLEAEPSR
jgi:putative heme-binding domain-containing protein